MRELGIGLIGTGFMGRAHALAFRNVSAVHELVMALAGLGQDGTDFERAWEVERLATAIRLAAQESRWVRIKEV